MHDQKAIQAEVEALKHDGRVMPEQVVEFARDPSTALHGCFTWDDTEAAHQHRLQQARHVIRVYVLMEDPGTAEVIRAFVALRSDRETGGGYRAIVDVLADSELHGKLMHQALSDLRAARNRYARLTELSAVFSAIDDLQEKFDYSDTKAA